MGLSTITPETRSEEFIDRIARALGSGGTSPLDTIVPETRHEEFIDRIARSNGWEDTSPMASIYPETRMEEFLNRIAENAGGSVEMETGKIIPESDIDMPAIMFENSHDTIPDIAGFIDVTGNYSATNGNLVCGILFNPYKYSGGTCYNDSSSLIYLLGGYRFSNGSSTSASNYNISSLASMSNFVTNEKYVPAGTTSSRYFLAGREYEWFAFWL